MKAYNIHFTDGSCRLSVSIHAACVQEALDIFNDRYPKMSIVKIE
jgi:hypothetical protein